MLPVVSTFEIRVSARFRFGKKNWRQPLLSDFSVKKRGQRQSYSPYRTQFIGRFLRNISKKLRKFSRDFP
jgi:hypothetical protein